MSQYWRVTLPAGVRPPFEVYVNGVRQELGVDFEVHEPPELVEHLRVLGDRLARAVGRI